MTSESPNPISESFKAAFQTRQFEIDLFWKRSLFFWGFIAAAFVAIGTLKDQFPTLSLLVSGFGVVCSCSWTLVNRGSKYWQEQWESKIERVEDEVIGPFFKKREPRQDKGWWLRGRRYSVSKITIAVSDYVTFVWLCIFGRQAWVAFALPRIFRHKSAVQGVEVAVPLLCSVLLLVFGRSSKGDAMQFEEKPGTMWSVVLQLDGKPYKRVFLSAPTAEDAQARVQASVALKDATALAAEPALYAMASPMPLTEFMWVPKKQL